MSNLVATPTEWRSAPAEWNVALRDVVFNSASEFVLFLASVGVEAEKLEFDATTGRAKVVNERYSCLQLNGEVQLTGYGIALLHSATGGDLALILKNLPNYTKSLQSSLFDRRRDPSTGEEDLSRQTAPSFQVRDAWSLELILAQSVRRLFPTSNITEFITHFDELVGELRAGIPYSDREQENKVKPGDLLKLYLLSFLQDEAALHGLSDRSDGGALSSFESARCISDETRTKKFLSAVRMAVTDFSKGATDTIEVIDAGCGAIPIQAIQAAILDPRVMVTALEFNPVSAAMARQIVAAIGLERQIAVIEADATEYKLEKQAHLIISETLHAGLGGEPVVQILNNLRSYLSEDGRMIPQSVEIKMGLVNLSDFGKSKRTIRTFIEEVPVTNPDWVQRIHYRFGEPLDKIRFYLDLPSIQESAVVCVGIDIDLGGEILAENESLITMPRLVLDGRKIIEGTPLEVSKDSSRILTSYHPGGIPIGLAV